MAAAQDPDGRVGAWHRRGVSSRSQAGAADDAGAVDSWPGCDAGSDRPGDRLRSVRAPRGLRGPVRPSCTIEQCGGGDRPGILRAGIHCDGLGGLANAASPRATLDLEVVDEPRLAEPGGAKDDQVAVVPVRNAQRFALANSHVVDAPTALRE